MSLFFRVAGRLLIFFSTRHRAVGIRDWIASLVSITVLLFICLIQTAVLLDLFSLSPTHPRLKPIGLFLIAAGALLLFAFPAVAFVIKLRRNGITDADYSVSSGIDYKAALESGGAGFDFVGVGGAKLRSHEAEFRTAVQATVSADKKIRMLLVDPSSDAMRRLEEHDNAVGYKETVTGSIQFIQRLADSQPRHFSLRHYVPKDDVNFKPFRLFFAGGDCLVSPFVKGTGVANQGRHLPQLRITERGWPKTNSPTLYRAFERYFNEMWDSSETEAPKK